MGSARLSGLALALALALGCRAPAPATAPAPAADPTPAPVVAPAPEPPRPEPAREGWIARSELDRVLDRGLGAFLGTVRVEAVLDGGRFAGWRVLGHDNEWVDVRPGDLLLSINGMPLETPTQVQALWDSLRQATVIDAALRRDGEPFAIRFRVGEPHAAEADAAAP